MRFSLLPYIMYSVSIRASMYTNGSYITICAYSMFLRLMYNWTVLRLMYRIHTHIHYIILGMLIAYRTKLLSPLSSKTRASASWLTTPLFIFRLFPGLRICTTLSPWQAVSIRQVSLCLSDHVLLTSDTANIQRF